MIPHHVYYQLAILGLLWLCVIFHRSYWDPGSFETSSSMSEPSNALPRLRTL